MTPDELARAAALALLENWPGMVEHTGYDGDELVQTITLTVGVK